MKYLKTSLVGIFVAVMLSGCVFSLHPLYTEKDVIYSSDLVGQWSEVEGEGKWQFQKDYDMYQYEVVHTDKDGKEGHFYAVLLKVGDHIFLDMQPEDPERFLDDFKVNNDYAYLLLPVHTFYHVKQITPVLQLRALDVGWLDEFLRENPKAVRHERTDKRLYRLNILLTAEPKELQEFLIKHFNTEDAFEDFMKLKRVSAKGNTETEKKELNTDANASGDSSSDNALPSE